MCVCVSVCAVYVCTIRKCSWTGKESNFTWQARSYIVQLFIQMFVGGGISVTILCSDRGDIPRGGTAEIFKQVKSWKDPEGTHPPPTIVSCTYESVLPPLPAVSCNSETSRPALMLFCDTFLLTIPSFCVISNACVYVGVCVCGVCVCSVGGGRREEGEGAMYWLKYVILKSISLEQYKPCSVQYCHGGTDCGSLVHSTLYKIMHTLLSLRRNERTQISTWLVTWGEGGDN